MFKNISTIQELLDVATRNYGEKPIFSYWRNGTLHSITYSDFAKQATAAAKSLILKGITNSKVAVASENSYEAIIWCFAVPLSGNVLVMLDNNEKMEEKAYRVLHSDASCLIYSDFNKPFYAYTIENNPRVSHTISIESDTPACINCEAAITLEETDGTQLSYIFYTSGTTGKPKGVMQSQVNLLRTNFDVSHKFSIKGSTLLTLPLNHILTFAVVILISMYKGANIFISAGLKTFMMEMQEGKPSFMFSVPAILSYFDKSITLKAKELMKTSNLDEISAGKQALEELLGGNLKVLIIGGAALDLEVANRMQALGVQVLNAFGMTEVGGGMIGNTNEDNRLGSIGSVADNWEVKEIEGELAFKSQYLFKGYYKNPEATDEVFDEEWFLTGDLGHIEDGYVYLTGRKKNLIVLPNGENVSPEELEPELMKIEGIIEVIVCEQEGKLTAKVYSDQDEMIIRKKINELNKTLTSYKQIEKIVFVDGEFPKTASKKIKRGDH